MATKAVRPLALGAGGELAHPPRALVGVRVTCSADLVNSPTIDKRTPGL